MITRSMHADSRQKQKAICDRLWARKVKTRDGYRCGVCGSGQRIEAAHIFSRRYQSTRWLLANGITLCGVHHRWYTKRPLRWAVAMEKWLGPEVYEALRVQSLSCAKLDYAQVRIGLEAA